MKIISLPSSFGSQKLVLVLLGSRCLPFQMLYQARDENSLHDVVQLSLFSTLLATRELLLCCFFACVFLCWCLLSFSLSQSLCLFSFLNHIIIYYIMVLLWIHWVGSGGVPRNTESKSVYIMSFSLATERERREDDFRRREGEMSCGNGAGREICLNLIIETFFLSSSSLRHRHQQRSAPLVFRLMFAKSLKRDKMAASESS